MIDLEVSIYPKYVTLFGVRLPQSGIIASSVILLLVLGLVVLYFCCIRRFTEKPKGLQNVLELAVESLESFAKGRVGGCARFVAPFALTFIFYVFFTTFVEIFGLPPATEDINCTVALGLCSFVMVNVTSVRFRGVKGRLRNLSTPSAVVFPVKVLADCIAPFSMGIRLFANVLVGGVIMQLIYAVVPLLLPAAISAYFNVLHVGIQTFVFALLFLTYTGEAVEEAE